MGGAFELLWLVLLAVAFWFLLIRPQRKRQLQVLQTQGAVGVGDEVMTNAGFFGRVTAEVDDPAAGDCLMLELAPGTVVKIARGAVLRVVTEPADEADLDTEPTEPTEPTAPTEPTEPTEPTGPTTGPLDDTHRSN